MTIQNLTFNNIMWEIYELEERMLNISAQSLSGVLVKLNICFSKGSEVPIRMRHQQFAFGAFQDARRICDQIGGQHV